MKLPATTICVRWCMMVLVVVAAVVPSFAVGYTTVPFELKGDVTGYSSFLTQFRDAVAAPTKACGLQSTSGTPSRGAEYIYVGLKFNTQTVTLGIDAKDLYVWAYQDDDRSNNRSNFVDDAPQAAKNSLFPGSTKRTTGFKGNYISLERLVPGGRMNITLGIPSLQTAIKAVYGKIPKQKDEAKFFLLAIQMVAEAARFRFMENAILAYDNSEAFKAKMVAFQNNWDRISTAIHKAEGEKQKCTSITPALVIYKEEVTTVNQIKNDMGLLKYKK